MKAFTVCLFGHRIIHNIIAVEEALDQEVRRLLFEKEYVEFLIGRDGDFDLLAASVIKRCKQAVCTDNSSLVWVLPYVTADLRDNEDAYLKYYDEIEIFEAGSHYKAAFQKRNKSMVDRSHLVICCIDHRYGGAYQAVHYAQMTGKVIINVAKA